MENTIHATKLLKPTPNEDINVFISHIGYGEFELLKALRQSNRALQRFQQASQSSNKYSFPIMCCSNCKQFAIADPKCQDFYIAETIS